MQEHPVPQNVTGYEFHLIGQMTLKQFMEVAVGVVIAILINTTNLPDFFKIPLIILVVGAGAGMAFVPLEGRSLDRWFFAFIRSIYQPTMFFWKKTIAIPDVFSYEANELQMTQFQTAQRIQRLTPTRSSRVHDFLQTLPGASAEESEEDKKINAILLLFEEQIAGKLDLPNFMTPAVSTNVFDSSSNGKGVEKAAPVIIRPTNKPIDLRAHETKKTLASDKPKILTPEPISHEQVENLLEEIKTAAHPHAALDAQPAQTSAKLPFPSMPKEPNKVVGMIVSSDEKIIENAIVTIVRKQDNAPVRALKTNALGQFAIITPLESNDYIVSIEKDGFHFDAVELKLEGKIIQPLFIHAKS